MCEIHSAEGLSLSVSLSLSLSLSLCQKRSFEIDSYFQPKDDRYHEQNCDEVSNEIAFIDLNIGGN